MGRGFNSLSRYHSRTWEWLVREKKLRRKANQQLKSDKRRAGRAGRLSQNQRNKAICYHCVVVAVVGARFVVVGDSSNFHRISYLRAENRARSNRLGVLDFSARRKLFSCGRFAKCRRMRPPMGIGMNLRMNLKALCREKHISISELSRMSCSFRRCMVGASAKSRSTWLN